MVLLIFLNGLYSARGNKEKWDFVQRRISYHHWIMCFDEQLLELAVVRYDLCALLTSPRH
jgi:hypothetical protein